MAYSLLARCWATLSNLLFLATSLILLSITVLSAFNPPQAVVAPERVNSYPQYIITLLLIGCYGTALFVISMLGLVSLCFLNSFLLFVFILAQCAMICVLMVAFAFTLTVRKRLHYKLEESWRGRPTCGDADLLCTPVETFRQSETFLICALVGFLILQIIQLAACWYLCERRSSQEKYKLQLQKADEDDE